MSSRRVSNETEDMVKAMGIQSTLAAGEILVDEQENLRRYDPKKIATLQANIVKNGLLQPLIVSEIPEELRNGGHQTHRLRAAYRRFEAITTIPEDQDRGRAPNLDAIPVVVIPPDVDPMSVNMSENTQREDMNTIAKAEAAHRRIEAGIAAGRTKTEVIKEVADDMGNKPNYVAQLLSLLTLRPGIKKRIEDGELPFRVARTLPGLEEKDQDEFLAKVDAAMAAGVSATEAVESNVPKTRKRKAGQGRKKKADKAEGPAAISSKKAILQLEETEGELLAASRAEGVDEEQVKAYKEAIGVIRIFGKYLSGRMGAQALGKSLTKRMIEE